MGVILNDIYNTCFLIGVIYSVISFLFMGLNGALHFHIDLPDFLNIFHAPDVNASLPIKPFMIVSFITVFGGIGNILLFAPFFQKMEWLTIPIAVIPSCAVSYFLYKCIYIQLLKVSKTVSKQSEALGIKATVLETIPQNGFGRISYSINSNILSSVAKEYISEGGIKKGETVIINDIRDNVFYVSVVK